MDSSLFSHPVVELPRPGALTAPQDFRYGGLFRQPAYTPAPPSDGAAEPRPASTWAHDPSGRRAGW
ncbi:hypothetical protein [Amycolatopsis vastitatis]|uniref:Uncharacterized protein n=1 Tax=Amycolatopsis vastitatis TaxID=1905142 RepID=A0A229T5M9_9PSEU|nr:hypothetical protein [Amycolatopsis vastitatis]OXM66224.1 hypothetical protein CF165_20525 [Amycolatopsis vastitatis]